MLAVGAAGAVIAIAIGAAISGRGVNAAEASLVGTVVGAAVATVANWLNDRRCR